MLSVRDSAVVSQAIEQVRGGIEVLTPAARHVYGLAVRQVYVEAVTDAFGLLLFVATVLVGWQWWKALAKKNASEPKSYEQDDFQGGAFVVLCIASLAAVIVAFIVFGEVTGAIANPEWRAITSLAEAINKHK